MSKITYTNKVALNENADIPNINKVTDNDMNEIKTVVNNSLIYSTPEKEIGEFIDGKPIYRKVVKNTTELSGSYITISVDLDYTTISDIVRVDVMTKKSGTNIWVINSENFSGDEFTYYVTGNNLTTNIVIKTTLTLEKTIIIIEYTKNTD